MAPADPPWVSPKNMPEGFSLASFIICLISACTFGLSRTSGFMVPMAATALRFFAPMTAPSPDLAAALPRSFMTAAILARRSPAGPIHATFSRAFPVSSLMSSSVTAVSLPQRCRASLISTLSFSMSR